MDSYEILVNALIVGAAGITVSSTHPSVNQAYHELKAMIDNNYPGVDLSKLEQSPGTKGLQYLVKDDLINAGAGNDIDLLEKAKQLLNLAISNKPESGLNFESMDN